MFEPAFQDPLGFDKQEEQPYAEKFDEMARQRYEYCVRVASIFKGKNGKEVLKVWREQTIEAATWMPSLALEKGLDAANAHAYAREGQNAFMKDIEACIEIAHNCKSLEDFCTRFNIADKNNL